MKTAGTLSLACSPGGRFYLEEVSDGGPGLTEPVAIHLRETIEKSVALAALCLAGDEFSHELPPSFSYLREVGRLYLNAICGRPEEETGENQPLSPPREELEALADTPPMITGAEYLTPEHLEKLWGEIDALFRAEATTFKGGIKEYIEARFPRWHMIGRVCFHLAENRASAETPFAFLATYTTRFSSDAKPRHLPLGRALEQYSGSQNRSALLNLLRPLQRATAESDFLRELIESGDIYTPLAWTPAEAHRFLKEVPLFESSGIKVRIPDWWKGKKPPRPEVSINIGHQKKGGLGVDSMLDFSLQVTLGGEILSDKECEALLSATNGLTLMRGKWVEIDSDKLKEVLSHWKTAREAAGHDGISFIEGMRLLSGTAIGRETPFSYGNTEWASVRPGEWLAHVFDQLKSPERLQSVELEGELKTRLRPYQETGVKWLWFLSQLRLPACLADDMGLGKTVQVIALLLLLKKNRTEGKKNSPHLLVVPASLIANWKTEMERFAPSLDMFIAHPSAHPASALKSLDPSSLENRDVVLTTYGTLLRLHWIRERVWGVVALDEAQAIKNPDARQTRAVKELKGEMRLALTGTPVENRLSDLWSLFDYLSPGLLGSAKAFSGFSKKLLSRQDNPYAPLRQLVRPYILRRLKSDKNIISDLPDKTEMRAFCQLTRLQAALYSQSVEALTQAIERVDGITRRGVVLSFLMRFKQICNHPSQWLGDGDYSPAQSGKFARLREICEEIAAKQEKCLVFTQFREITDVLSRFLEGVFGRSGLVLHGNIEVKKRKDLVEKFQEEFGPPFFVLSLKAGGTGLNLTEASHVIHFDRWWNPAVENQATDRAFRIGQKKNVLVHKFVCRGTIEDKIDALIEVKQGMSRELIEGGPEKLLTEMSNEDLIGLVSLDLTRALEES